MPRIQDRRTDRCGRWILLLVLFTFIITERCAAREMKIVIGTDLHYISSQLEDGGERFMRLLYDADGNYTGTSGTDPDLETAKNAVFHSAASFTFLSFSVFAQLFIRSYIRRVKLVITPLSVVSSTLRMVVSK